jgi:hypothetical protein
MLKLIGSIGIFAALLAIFILAGWVKNVYEITKLDFQAPYKAEIIRGGALVAFPLAGIIGWMNIKDGQVKVDNAASRP